MLTEFTPPRSIQPVEEPVNITSMEKQPHFCYFFHAKMILFQGWICKEREFNLPSRTCQLHTIPQRSFCLFISFTSIWISFSQIGIKKVVIPGISEFTVQKNVYIYKHCYCRLITGEICNQRYKRKPRHCCSCPVNAMRHFPYTLYTQFPLFSPTINSLA